MPTISTALNQAMLQVQAMPAEKQQEIFDFIDFIAHKNTVAQANKQPPTQTKGQKQSQERVFGLYQGKGSFSLSDDFAMTEEELINL